MSSTSAGGAHGNRSITTGAHLQRFAMRLGILLLPFVVGAALSIFALPLDVFTFRVWEAISAHTPQWFEGPFYPNVTITTSEVGDLGRRTDAAIRKDVTWQTDEYGYRFAGRLEVGGIVIVGDSMTAGSSLTQQDVFSEQLSTALDRTVYPYAPVLDPRSLMAEPRFRDSPPEIVIIQFTERQIPFLQAPPEGLPRSREFSPLMRHPYVTPLLMAVDRTRKAAFLRMVRANLASRLGLSRVSPSTRLPDGTHMLFHQGADALLPSSPEYVEETAERMAAHVRWFQSRDISAVLVIAPNKESVYPELVPDAGSSAPTFMPLLAESLRNRGIPYSDVHGAMIRQRAEEPDRLLYHLDDSHWNATGVGVAVQETVRALKEIR